MEYLPTAIDTGTYVARTVTPDDRYDHIPVRVLNVQHSTCSVKAGTPVSDLEALDLMDSEQKGNLETVSRSTYVFSDRNSEIPVFLKKLLEGVDPATPENTICQLQELILAYRHIFSEDETELGGPKS